MSDTAHSYDACSSGHCLLAFPHPPDWRVGSLITTLAALTFQQAAHVGNHGHFSTLAVFCPGDGIAFHGDFASRKIAIRPTDVCRFCLSETTKGHKTHQ